MSSVKQEAFVCGGHVRLGLLCARLVGWKFVLSLRRKSLHTLSLRKKTLCNALPFAVLLSVAEIRPESSDPGYRRPTGSERE